MFVLSLFLTVLASVSLPADEAAVLKAVDTYPEAFNRNDLNSVSAMWAVDATHTDRGTGDRTEGRDAIKADIATAFEESPDTKLAAIVDRVRFIKSDVARVEGRTTLGTPGEEPVLSTFSAILVEQDGKWLIDSIEEIPLSRPATPYDALRELEWLVGQWIDESEGARVDTTIRWTADCAFRLHSFVAILTLVVGEGLALGGGLGGQDRAGSQPSRRHLSRRRVLAYISPTTEERHDT